MSDRQWVGDAVDVLRQPSSFLLKLYLKSWRILGRLSGMAQGAAPFSRRDAFRTIGGYDEDFYMGEDVEFYWQLGHSARKSGKRTAYISDIKVTPSPRRFDKSPLGQTLLCSDPVVILLLRRQGSPWRGWLSEPPRRRSIGRPLAS